MSAAEGLLGDPHKPKASHSCYNSFFLPFWALWLASGMNNILIFLDDGHVEGWRTRGTTPKCRNIDGTMGDSRRVGIFPGNYLSIEWKSRGTTRRKIGDCQDCKMRLLVFLSFLLLRDAQHVVFFAFLKLDSRSSPHIVRVDGG